MRAFYVLSISEDFQNSDITKIPKYWEPLTILLSIKSFSTTNDLKDLIGNRSLSCFVIRKF